MASVNIHDAKTHLSKLLARVEAGETITIARAGKPIARLVSASDPTSEPSQEDDAKGFGWAKGKVIMHGDFNDPMPDAWYDEMENSGPV